MGSITLNTEVDDYIAPSQACINPLFASTTATKKTNGNKSKSAEHNKESSIRPRRTRTRIRKPLTLEDPSLQNITSVQQTKEKPAILSYDDNAEDSVNFNVPSASVPLAIPHLNKKSKSSSSTASNVSIADCLACSGCITSSEAVLVARHSLQTLKEQFHSKNKNDNIVLVFTISHSSVANLSYMLYGDNGDGEEYAHKRTTMVLRKLASFLHETFGARLLLDGAVTQKISLIHSALEFCHRYQCIRGGVHTNIDDDTWMKRSEQKKEEHVPNIDVDIDTHSDLDARINLTTPSVALSSSRTRYLVQSTINAEGQHSRSDRIEGVEVEHGVGRDNRLGFLHHNSTRSISTQNDLIPSSSILPMLSSSCPGFVCYVEKSNPATIANLTTVKSPMAIAGYMLKHNSFESSGVGGKRTMGKAEGDSSTMKKVYHVGIMPCHDKKLEAERKDLAHVQDKNDDLVPDVDLVITTNELWALLEDAANQQKPNTATDKHDLDYPMSMGHDDDREELVNTMNIEMELLNRKDGSPPNCTAAVNYFHSLPLAATTHFNSWSKSLSSNVAHQPLVVMDEDVDIGIGKDETSSARSTSTSSISKTMKGSGSYAEFIFRFASHHLFGHEIDKDKELPWRAVSTRRRRQGRTLSRRKIGKETGASVTGEGNHLLPPSKLSVTSNDAFLADYCEVYLYRHRDGSYSCHSSSKHSNNDHDHITHEGKALKDNDKCEDEIVLKFATAYGFKNIQMMMQRFPSSSVSAASRSGSNNMKMHGYDYLEVMACPSGCLNGGGQVSSSTFSIDSSNITREKPSDVRERVMSSQRYVRDVMTYVATNSRENRAGRTSVQQQESSDLRYNPMLHTRFHVVPKMELSKGATAGVAVDDTQW